LTCPLLYAYDISQEDNLSSWDIAIQNSLIQDNVNQAELAVNIEKAKEQKQQSRDAFIKKVISQANEAGIVPKSFIEPLSVKSTYTWTNLIGFDSDDGGSGVGWSGSNWNTTWNANFNGSRAEIAGSYWAEGRGWVYYTPATSGNYDVFASYYLTGRIIGGNFTTKLLLIDTNTGSEYEQTLYNTSTSQYFDNVYKSHTKNFYLTAGHTYAITFVTETSASATVSATMSDFYSQEFDGTQREIGWYSFSVTPR
jgi:hypothetical protein